MISRRALGGIALAAMGCWLSVGIADAQAPKKKLRPANDKDGTNDVIGAVWNVTAVNEETKDRRTFGFRAKDGVLFGRAGREVGFLEAVKPTETLMTWKEPLPLRGKFKITMNKVGEWGGILETEEGEKWRCVLRCTDR